MKKRNRLPAVLVCAVLACSTFALSLLSTTVFADTVTLIDDKAELSAINGSGSYRLTADIDLAGADWTPLQTFSGTLDGGGHVIRNLSITDTTTAGDNKGLFLSIADGGSVCNLGIEGANITAGDNVGIIAANNAGTISRCYTKGTVSGKEYVGGITGQNSGRIDNSYSHASVSGTDYLGGVAGSNSGTITKCYVSSTVTDSVLNNYLQFNSNDVQNSGGYISIPHKAEYVGEAFTLEAWFQWENANTNTDTDKVAFIIGKGYEQFEIHTGGGAGKNGLRFIPIPNDTKGTLGGYPADSWIDVHDVLQAGWFHVAAVYSYSGSTASVQIYVNGEAQDLYQISSDGPVKKVDGKTANLNRYTNPLANNTNPINIGRRTDGTYYFDGKIADVRFWNTARTADEIKTNKDKVLNGNETGLVGYWKLNDDLGDTVTDGEEVTDATSFKNDGTIHGNVTQTTSSGSAANKGGLTGADSGSVTGCFYNQSLYGQIPGGSGTAKPDADMKSKTTYTDAGWNFSKIWDIASDDYPFIRAISTVTLNKNGGNGGTDSVQVTYGSTMPAVEVPTRTDYSFNGYFDAESGGARYYKSNGTSACSWDKTTDATLYAQWTAGSPVTPPAADPPHMFDMGDDFRPVIWIIVMLIAIGGLVASVTLAHRKRKRQG